ncbi:MAG: Fic family protein [bacterium]|nr:Fic family protein [bacterium]
MKDILTQVDDLQKEINSLRPLDKHLVKQVKEYFRIGLTYSSNALEGNSLTETETKIIIEDGITIGGKPLKDHYEAVGHSESFDLIYRLAKKEPISENAIKKLHKLFYYRIDSKNAGKYRKNRAFISGSKYPLPLPEKLPDLMKEFVENLPSWKDRYHPVEYAALAHKEFVFIHPFIDGNGRVSRLLTNLILLQEGYTIVIIPPVLRQEYIAALEKAHTSEKDFIQFIAGMVKETQKDYLRLFK